MKTTLKKIREHYPCKDGWEKLLKHLGKNKADDEPLSLLTILDSNGLDDALWSLRAVDGYEKEMRLYAVWCARQVQHFMTDQKSIRVLRDAVGIAERYAHGRATFEELKQARAMAWDVARVTACVTARAAAWAAETAMAWDVARVAAWEAARAAAWVGVWNMVNAEQETEFRRMLKLTLTRRPRCGVIT